MSQAAPTTPPQVPPPPFLDVAALLERSQPRPRTNWFWYAGGAFLLVMILSGTASAQSPQMASVVRLLSSLLMLGVIAAMMGVTWYLVKSQREEVQRLEAVEELVQLRRWDQAAALLQQTLSQPTRSPQARVQGLVFLSSVLGRYHRFDDAVAVQNHLLEHVHLDDNTNHALRLGRTMSMLRADHLFDADRAINDLRRTSERQERDSAGLALVEIYRDVKTGHPAEAVEMFEAKLPVLREQLGTRVADAYALAARAYDLLGRDAEAARAFERATLLTPATELSRRYPEVVPLLEKYSPAPSPFDAPAQPTREAASGGPSTSEPLTTNN